MPTHEYQYTSSIHSNHPQNRDNHLNKSNKKCTCCNICKYMCLVIFTLFLAGFLALLIALLFADEMKFYTLSEKLTKFIQPELAANFSTKSFENSGNFEKNPDFQKSKNSSSNSKNAKNFEKQVKKYQFDNPWNTWKEAGLTDLARWQFGSKPQSEKDYEKLHYESELYQTIKNEILNSTFYKNSKMTKHNSFLVHADRDLTDASQPIQKLKEVVPPGKIKLTWFGHASVLAQFSDFNIFFDPVFTTYASPIQFWGPEGIKRQTKVPATVQEMAEAGVKIDVVAISHNHYDHLAIDTLKQFIKYYPKIKFMMAKNDGRIMESFLTVEQMQNNFQDFFWWENKMFQNDSPTSYRLTFVPAQHWSNRGAGDKRLSLWGGYVIEQIDTSSQQVISSMYFTGDTGYCSVFHEIREHFENQFTISCLPIGAYRPRWFMAPQHVSPEEALQMFEDLNTKQAMPIHWLTYNLADDADFEAYIEFEYFKRLKNVGQDNFKALVIGQSQIYE